MSQQELLIAVAASLDEQSVAYLLTGSIVSSLFGEPRLTHDIDILVQASALDPPKLARSFPPPRYYLDAPESIERTIREGSMFNLIDVSTGDKVDFWILSDSPFDLSRLQRRKRLNLFGALVWVSSPEDIIIAKLSWAKLSGSSEKQFQDALRVFEVQGVALDLGYCELWAARQGVRQLWERLLAEAEQQP
ncbi:MAG: hypothetical protein A2V99_06685 [Spirochaetes bacterium RBG_16_67_19]|nr:MAG: hypothetical protein A2V99_06685 [Spirochaetes bacterium RBG_16_67_19]